MEWPKLQLAARPRIETLAVDGQPVCHVVDGALDNPEAWRAFAAASRHAFVDAPFNAFPGPELRLPDAVSAGLGQFFDEHLRRSFDARRTERMYARLSMVNRKPEALQPWQWQPHVDQLQTAPGQCVAASVLYLFEDESLGGTSFYRPRRDIEATMAMIEDSSKLAAEDFSRKHGVAPGYMTESNHWYEKVGTVPAVFNRLIVYSGTVFHSGEIAHPEKLSDNPLTGRLTINGFFTCRRNAR
jgi:hypothetical protein